MHSTVFARRPANSWNFPYITLDVVYLVWLKHIDSQKWNGHTLETSFLKFFEREAILFAWFGNWNKKQFHNNDNKYKDRLLNLDLYNVLCKNSNVSHLHIINLKCALLTWSTKN